MQMEGWDNYFYDEAARNSIDVGEHLGRCLAALTATQGVPASSLHLAGHRQTQLPVTLVQIYSYFARIFWTFTKLELKYKSLILIENLFVPTQFTNTFNICILYTLQRWERVFSCCTIPIHASQIFPSCITLSSNFRPK